MPAATDLLRGPRDLLAQPHEARALLLALAFEPLGVDRDSRLRLGDQLLLSLRKLRELVRHAALRTFEVVSPMQPAVLRPAAALR